MAWSFSGRGLGRGGTSALGGGIPPAAPSALAELNDGLDARALMVALRALESPAAAASVTTMDTLAGGHVKNVLGGVDHSRTVVGARRPPGSSGEPREFFFALPKAGPVALH